MRLAILCIFAAALCAPCFAQTTTVVDSEHLPAIPVIVAKKQVINQVGSINTVTLYTVENDVDLIAYAYIETPSCTLNGTVESTRLFWTDDFEQTIFPFSSLQCTPKGGAYFSSGFLIIHAKAGTPIQIDTLSDKVTAYNLYITLERL